MPPALYLSGPCRICEQPAHGNHFGVMSCRACAAFFRRAASRSFKYLELVCENGNCKIFDKGKYNCKKCRLKKCYDSGMDSKKFQTDHDLLSSTHTFKSKISPPPSLANFLGRPEFILCCEPEKGARIKTKIDVSFLIEKAIRLFEEDPKEYCIPFQYDTSLEKLAIAVENMKLRRKSNLKIEIVKYIGKEENLMFWEKTFLSAAQWFAEIPEFAELEMTVKIEILKSAWMMWARLDKLAETAEFYKRKLLDQNVFMFTDDTCMDVNDVVIDLKWCTNYSADQLRAYMVPDVNKYWIHAFNDMLCLEPTNIELNFMILQLCLNEAGKRNQGKVLEAADHLLQVQADNLHDYYTKKQNMTHYSGRLARLMKVNKRIETEVRERKEMNFLSGVFNLYNVEYSHPEMFVGA
ncbi:unnamed protein product [Caenorhabditis brenneri]